MTSQSVLITDTNIWIDLDNGGILADVFRLPYHFLTPDIATRELIRPRWQTLQALGLVLHELEADQVTELVQLRLFHRNLSIIDLAAFLLAKDLDATLLTGDSRLYELAVANGLSVRGVLWLLDEIIRLRVLVPERAAVALQKMLEMGARLPRDECRKRLVNWST
jgi:predicted nucleic acid-binding protein